MKNSDNNQVDFIEENTDMMCGEPTLEQWEELYSVAKNIRLMSPWEYLWDSDLITIMLPGRKEPVYCSVMGRLGECYGIGIYPGYESIREYYRMTEIASNTPSIVTAFSQNCLMLNFGDREEVTPKDREVYKALNLRFRGRNEWIYFRSMEPGYYPWYFNFAQADLMINVLQNFAMVCKHLVSNEINANFEAGETIVRYYSPEEELWFNVVEKMSKIPIIVPKLIVDNEILIAGLKKQKCNRAKLEIELTYIPTPIQENKNDRPYMPRFVLLMDRNSEAMLDQHLLSCDDYAEEIILNMLTRYIQSFGKPASINIRDDRTGRYIYDFCQKVGIKLIEAKGMLAVDTALESLLEFML